MRPRRRFGSHASAGLASLGRRLRLYGVPSRNFGAQFLRNLSEIGIIVRKGKNFDFERQSQGGHLRPSRHHLTETSAGP